MRLTEMDGSGNWWLKGVRWESLRKGEVLTEETAQRIYGALYKLRDYEETGLDPEQVERIAERNE